MTLTDTEPTQAFHSDAPNTAAPAALPPEQPHRLPPQRPPGFYLLATAAIVTILGVGIVQVAGAAYRLLLGIDPGHRSESAQGPAAPTEARQTLPPVSEGPRHVDTRQTGDGRSQTFSYGLSEDEAIVGDAHDVNYQLFNGCVAFLFRGPGRVSFALTSGAANRYEGVRSREDAERLLQLHVDYLRTEHSFCPDRSVKIVRQ